MTFYATFEILNRASRVYLHLNDARKIVINFILTAGVQWKKTFVNYFHENAKIFFLTQKEIQSETNESKQLIKLSNNRAMDACEIANFLASELFMHQVSYRIVNSRY